MSLKIIISKNKIIVIADPTYNHFLNSYNTYGLEEYLFTKEETEAENKQTKADPRVAEGWEHHHLFESLLEMGSPGRQPRPRALEALGVGPRNCVLTSPPEHSHAKKSLRKEALS